MVKITKLNNRFMYVFGKNYKQNVKTKEYAYLIRTRTVNMARHMSRRMVISGSVMVGAGLVLSQYEQLLMLAPQHGISSVAAGRGFSVVVRDGEVFAWGNNQSSQCDIPRNLPAIKAVHACFTRSELGYFDYVLALSVDGEAFVWGRPAGGSVDARFAIPRNLPPIIAMATTAYDVFVLLAEDKKTLYILRAGAEVAPEVIKWPIPLQSISDGVDWVTCVDVEGNVSVVYVAESLTAAPVYIIDIAYRVPVKQANELRADGVFGVDEDGNVVVYTGVTGKIGDKNIDKTFSIEERNAISEKYALNTISDVRQLVRAPENIGFYTVSDRGILEHHLPNDSAVNAQTQQMLRGSLARNQQIARISSSWTHVLVVTKDGELHAWGDNAYGQCDIPRALQI